MRAQKKVQDSSHNFLVCWQTLCKRKLNWTDISWFEFEGQLTYANHSYPFYRERGIGRSTDAPKIQRHLTTQPQRWKKVDLKALGHIFTGEDFYLPKGEVWGAPDTKLTMIMYIEKTNKTMKAGVYILSFSNPHLKRGHNIAQFIPVIRVREAPFRNVLVLSIWTFNK